MKLLSTTGRTALIAALGIAAAAGSLSLTSTSADAATCRIIIYYSDASHDDAVGTWSNCPGQKGLTGRRTRFSEVMTETIPNPRPGPGNLPCEFLEAGCSNLPVQRH